MKTTLRITICPTCGSDQIKRVRRVWKGSVGGQSYSVSTLEFYACPICGERVYSPEAMRRIEAAKRAAVARGERTERGPVARGHTKNRPTNRTNRHE